MLQYVLFIVSLSVGGYVKEVVNKDHYVMYNAIKEDVSKYLRDSGYNGILHNGPPVAAWSQVVQGRNVILRVGDICVRVYDKFGEFEFQGASPCTDASMINIIRNT